MRIPIKAVREFGKKFGMSHVIIFAKEDGQKRSWVSTWGRTIIQCGEAADFGNRLKDNLGWPSSLHQQPSRVRRLQDENTALRSLGERYLALWHGMKRSSLGPGLLSLLDETAGILGVNLIGGGKNGSRGGLRKCPSG